MLHIRLDDLSTPEVHSLLRLHLAGMHASSPPGHVFALDTTGLRAPGVSVWTAWSGEHVAGIAALKRLAPGQAELKSMRTHPHFLRRGVAAALLDHIIAIARTEGISRLSLETGIGPAFEPALALYRQRGFTKGEAFTGYVKSDFNQFLHMNIGPSPQCANASTASSSST